MKSDVMSLQSEYDVWMRLLFASLGCIFISLLLKNQIGFFGSGLVIAAVLVMLLLKYFDLFTEVSG